MKHSAVYATLVENESRPAGARGLKLSSGKRLGAATDSRAPQGRVD